jgi:membrane carboxypeptidase/penicillin-binding protein
MSEEMTAGKLMDTEKFQEEYDKERRRNNILRRYNRFYNIEVSGLSWGTPTSMEELQAIALRSMLDALITEHMNQEYNSVAICDIEDLIDGLYQQSNDALKRVKKFEDSAEGVS